MPLSAPQSARRAFVKLLITVAAVYAIILEGFSRESGGKAVERANSAKSLRRVCKQVVLKKGNVTKY